MIIESHFQPAAWLRNPHAQTIFASRFRQVPLPASNSERLSLPDGDFVDLNFSTGVSHLRRNNVLVCLFHGLQGSIDSHYIRATMNQLADRGYDSVLMHFRGCSGEPNKRIQSYHSGHTADMRFLFSVLQDRYPDSTLFACGFSLGANALLKFQGEEGEQSPLALAIAVSPPFQLDAGARRMNKGLSRLYQRYLINSLKASTRQRMAAIENFPIKEPELNELNDFWQFDDRVTARLNGFRDVHDYYRKSSCKPYLSLIKKPTHIIHSRDDPFFEPEIIPISSELSSACALELSTHGGHVGFVGSNGFGLPSYWLEDRIVNIIDRAAT